MIVLRNKVFSTPKENSNDSSNSSIDVRALKNIGGTGLVIGGGLTTAAGVELGKSIKNLNDIKGDISGIKKLRKNKYIRERIKDLIKRTVPQYSDQIIDKARFVESHFPKVNKIDKYTGLLKMWDTTARTTSRTMLDNADRYTEIVIGNLDKEIGDKLSDIERKHLNNIPKVVKKAAKSITQYKNAKALGRAGLLIGSLGGTSYINGRMIEGGGSKPN